jgi:nitronate monooxygenase
LSPPSSRAAGLTARLGIEWPIVQAPMAGGPTTPALVAAVGAAGALGSLGAALMSPAAIHEAAAAIRASSDRPFAINLFVLPPPDTSAGDLAAALARLAPFHAELGLPAPVVPNSWGETLEAQIDAVLAVSPAVVSTHFGPPPPRLRAGCRTRGIAIFATATTPDEAVALEAAGVDAVVAQGAEAGGHRGSFLGDRAASPLGTMVLVPAIVDRVGIPVIAAGGIMDGRGIRAALSLGAAAVQMGTAFLACPEAGTHRLHKAALATAPGTMVTRGVTGRFARGLRNRLLETLDRDAVGVHDYPVQNALSSALRVAAARAGRPDLMAMWAGQGHAAARAEPAGQLVAAWVREAGLAGS